MIQIHRLCTTVGKHVYRATLVVQDNQSPSCLDTTSKFISLAVILQANITSDTVCLGDTTRFSR